jgi:1-acyl-sn-glycerol-3-phosphate acyltransferase
VPELRLRAQLARAALPASVNERLDHLQFIDAGHGYDVFGLSREGLREAIALVWPLYTRYFRVESRGGEHIPPTGAAVLACNHSGMLPLDGFMVAVDVFLHAEPPRMIRTVADHFVPRLPWFSTFAARAGAIGGSRGNVHHVLERGELLMVYPEGAKGIGKGFSQRYRLQHWSVGHVELAILHRAPVVPMAVIGAEEQWPQIARIESIHPFGAPWLPIPATLLPLPVRYHIRYGAPIHFEREHEVGEADDPQVLERGAERVKQAVAELIEQGLAERDGWFR